MKRRARNINKISLKTIIIIITIILIVIVMSIYTFSRFYQNGDQTMAGDGWVNVELHYIGSAKTDWMKISDIVIDYEPWLRTEGELTYTYLDYYFLYDYSHYLIDNQWFEFYDLDFAPQSALEKGGNSHYVLSLGRKLEWLQYNPNEISDFGGVINRAGKEWSAEVEEDTVYFYEFEYSGIKHLADVSMEF